MATRPAAVDDLTAELRRLRRRLADALRDLERAPLGLVDLRAVDAEAERLAGLTAHVLARLDEAWEEIG